MKEKKKIIIDSATRLFAHKGFSSTSIREIVEESGISKGAFYIYFKSKDELLVAILKSNFEKIQSSVFSYENNSLSPQEKFSTQLTMLFNTIMEHKEMVIMLSREQTLPFKKEIKKMVHDQQIKSQRFFQNSLAAIYGQKVKNHLWDLSLILEGLFQPFLGVLIFDEEALEIEDLSMYLLKRIDSIVEDLVNEKPLLTGKRMPCIIDNSEEMNDIESMISQIKNELEIVKDKGDLNVALEVLEEEVQKENPRVPVISGMLFNLKQVSGLEKHIQAIADYYDINL